MGRPFIPVENVAVFDVLQDLGGVPYCNSFHWWLFGDVWTLANLESVATAMQSWFIDHMLPLFGTGVTYTGVRCRDLTTETSLTFDLTTAPVASSFPSEALPLNCAVYLKSRNFLLPPKHTFYNVFSGIPESEVTANQVSDSYLNDLFEAYILFQDIPIPLDVVASNVSYEVDGAYRPAGAIFGLGHIYRPKKRIGNRSRRIRNYYPV